MTQVKFPLKGKVKHIFRGYCVQIDFYQKNHVSMGKYQMLNIS